ncbi:unnamed protein product [Adineta ricciae]|uniref:Uncharacterized protein n=1 Tax=Adineta ricciae TaxID=249248 RepID=A0A813VVN1_ADIRI|nr:unnamed protein product [Adineta ricciae]CAF1042320.1 unnamed protein product [Adineta ricciae]
MKDIIAQRLDEKWDTVILDGTKPPINKHLRKKLNSIRKSGYLPPPRLIQLHQVPVDPPHIRAKKGITDDSISNQINYLTLTNDISPEKIDPVLTYSTPVKVDQSIIVLSPSTNHPSINDNMLPIMNDCQGNDMKLVCGDENVIDDEPMEQYDVEDSYLENLKEEIDVLVKQLDVRMITMQARIDKTTRQLTQMHQDFDELVIMKQKTISEFNQKVKEHENKIKKPDTTRKSLKRMKQATKISRRK